MGPRTRTVPGNGLRLDVSAREPIFLINLSFSTSPEGVRATYDAWPADLRWMLGFQVIFDAHNPMPEPERGPALDRILTVTDDLDVPTLVQVGTFLGWGGPDRATLDAAFDEHPSLAGVSLAELSAGIQTAITGLTDDQTTMILDAMDVAVANDATFLWADMGYVGPQVFVSAGADPRIARVMRSHPDNMVIQVKQNGLGRRFGSWSAAFGFYAAGFASAWGVNSEDWIWWEASLEQLYGPQVPGGLTAGGMVKSEFPNRSRLSYPESLFGTEIVVAASSGATVFSIESPARVIDAETHEPTVMATKVLFPVLRALTRSNLIPNRNRVLARTEIAFQPADANPPELAWDRAFTGLYGPDGCTEADQITCAQRQWLPSTGRYGIIPTIPSLATGSETQAFSSVVSSLIGSEAATRERFDAVYPDVVGGDSWAAPAAHDGAWFLANPNENADTPSTFELPKHEGASIEGTLPPQSFAVVTTKRDTIEVLVDGYRSDSAPLWTPRPTSDLSAAVPSGGNAAPSAESVIVVRFDRQNGEPDVDANGATVRTGWDADRGELTVTAASRGAVSLTVGRTP